MSKPAAIAFFGLILSIALLAGTLSFGRRTVTTVVARPSSPAQAATAQIQRELDRLTGRYQRQLQSLLQGYRSFGPAEAQRIGRKMVGVVQVSRLSEQESGPFDQTVPIQTEPVVAQPTLRESNGLAFLLDRDEIFDSAEANSGWISGDPGVVYYWDRDQDSSIEVATLNLEELSQSISGWLADPELTGFNLETLLGNGGAGADRVLDFHQHIVWTSDTSWASDQPAHRVTATNSPLGQWFVQSRDPLVSKTEWQSGFLIGGLSLTALMALGSVLASNAYRQALDRAEQRVSFVNRVSHELRTPITNILLNTELAEESIAAKPDDAARRLGLIREESSRLSRLIENVLTFSRREQNGLDLSFSETAPDVMIERVLDHFAPSLKRRGFEIQKSLAAPSPIETDEDVLFQILTNLVSNIEKYGENGAWLGITSSQDTDRVTIRISDRGPGIPRSARELIFEPFYRQSDQVSEGVSGTGLGLTIARELARRLGGNLILVDSNEEPGATFELNLPA